MSEKATDERPGTGELRFAIAAIPGGFLVALLLGLLASSATDTTYPTTGAVTFTAALVLAGCLVSGGGLVALARGLWLRSQASYLGAWALFAMTLPIAWLFLTYLVANEFVWSLFDRPAYDDVFDIHGVMLQITTALTWFVVLSGVIAGFRWIWRKVA